MSVISAAADGPDYVSPPGWHALREQCARVRVESGRLRDLSAYLREQALGAQSNAIEQRLRSAANPLGRDEAAVRRFD